MASLKAQPEPGRLLLIWIKRARLLPMDEASTAELEAGAGLCGNANRGGKRQVTVLSGDAWRDVQAELGEAIDPVLRRANLFIEGLDLHSSRGKVLAIGVTEVHIYGETFPCRAMEEAHAGLQQALRPAWRGGVFGEVLTGGPIEIGDPILWVEPTASEGQANKSHGEI